MVIDYDRAAADYEASLVTKLRGHGAGNFLENWVPDPDPALGIFNMIEAAWTGGRDRLEILVSRSTLDASALERLKKSAAVIADVRVTSAGEQNRLEIQRAAGRAPVGARQPAPGARAKALAIVRARHDQGQKKTTPPLQPMLAEALRAATASFTHEGEAPAAGAKLRIESVSENGAVSLAVGDGDIIRAARHNGVQPAVRRGLLELMCREIEGRTVQDAADHGAVLVIHRLRQRVESRPAPGILLPANAGTEVIAALEMLRGACRKYQEQSSGERKPNFFERGPSAAWQALPAADKVRKAAEAISTFCRAEGKGATAVRLDHVEKDIHGHEIRIIIQADAAAEREGVPFFLRRLERFLKANLEEALQVYLEPVKDKNVLRRL
jgi:hypothetical protein